MDEPLIIEGVYMFEKENAIQHHTHTFELVQHMDNNPTAVLRRGQTFNMALRLNRDYIDETDIVRLLFSFGPNPNVLRGTKGINTINGDAYMTDLEAWGVRLLGSSGPDLSIEVRSPIDSPVGVWQLNVETTTVNSRQQAPRNFSYDKDIYLLFNPWHRGECYIVSLYDMFLMICEKKKKSLPTCFS